MGWGAYRFDCVVGVAKLGVPNGDGVVVVPPKMDDVGVVVVPVVPKAPNGLAVDNVGVAVEAPNSGVVVVGAVVVVPKGVVCPNGLAVDVGVVVVPNNGVVVEAGVAVVPKGLDGVGDVVENEGKVVVVPPKPPKAGAVVVVVVAGCPKVVLPKAGVVVPNPRLN